MNRFSIPTKLTACVFALLCLASIAQASSPPAEDNVHFCQVLDYEDMRARDSLYAARKQALNLNVGEPRTVRMIYFLPNDRPFRQEVVDSMKTTIRQIQTFFREQMRANGYGDMTFRFETDAGGNPMVHRVDGQYSDSHYLDHTSNTVLDEVGQAFDRSLNVYLIVVDNSIDLIGLGGVRQVGGVGYGGRNGGYGMVPGGFGWQTAAHELGHAFGLWHDFRSDAYIMSYGSRRYLLSACHAEFLSVHPYFNLSIPDGDTPPPTVELISSPLYPAGSKNVSVRFRASDPDGLHQVLLFVRTKEPHGAAGSFEVKACRGLNGERDAVVQFDYDGVIPSDGKTSLLNFDEYWITLEAVDIFGNVGRTTVEVTCGNCPITLAKISGDNQQGASGEALTNPFVVEVRDKNGVGLAGFPVRFTVTAGDGRLSGRFSGENATTDANGRAQSTLTLGDYSGTNTVEVSVAGRKVAFNAVGVGTPAPPIGSDYQTWHLPAGAIARLGKGSIEEVAFSPDGSLLAVASGIGIWFYDAATSRELALLTGHSGSVESVSFSPDGSTLASGANDGTVKLWDVATRRNIATLRGHRNNVYSVSFSLDGSTLASGSWDKTVKLWDVATRRNIATLEGHTHWVFSVSFSPDGNTLASGSSDYTVKLWDVATRRNIATLEGHTSVVYSVSFSPDGSTLASGSHDNTVKLWDVATRQNIATLEGHSKSVESVSFSPDGSTLASGSRDYAVKLWDVATRQNIATLEGHTRDVYSVSFSPDGSTLASGSSDNTVKLWDVATKSWNFFTHTRVAGKVSFSPDGSTLASGSWDGTVKLWDVATRQNIATLEAHTSNGYSVSFSPDGSTLASGGGTITLWDVATRRNIATLEGHTYGVGSVSFSPDGSTLASGSSDRTVKLWDVATRRNIATLEGHSNAVESVSFSPDGSTLASGSWDKTVKLWDVATRRNIATLEGHSDQVESVSFSPDGSTLASGSHDNTVKLWDVATRRNIATLTGHRYYVTSVSFSPDGSTLASGSWDKTVKLWDVATRRNIATLTGHTSGVESVSFSPDGSTLASRSRNYTVLLWDMSPYITPLTSFSLSLDGDGAAGDQAVTTLKVSPGPVATIQVFGKGIRQATGISARFEYDSAQVAYEGFDAGGLLPNAQVLVVSSTNPTAVEIDLVSFGGQATADSGLVGNIRFRRMSAFSGTTLRLVRAELGRGTQRERVTFADTHITLQPAAAALTPDFNGDGRVDSADFVLFTAQYGLRQGDPGYDAWYDLDGDGTIGFGDFLIFGSAFGREGS